MGHNIDNFVQPRHQGLKRGDRTDGVTFGQPWAGEVVRFGVGRFTRESFAIVKLDKPIADPHSKGRTIDEILVRTGGETLVRTDNAESAETPGA